MIIFITMKFFFNIIVKLAPLLFFTDVLLNFYTVKKVRNKPEEREITFFPFKTIN
jgi:hypothetical protein